ncbi:MAG: recombinase family protein [Alphaproteobacteria bacterium]
MSPRLAKPKLSKAADPDPTSTRGVGDRHVACAPLRLVRDTDRRVALYARIGADGPTVAKQVRELKTIAGQHGWQVVTTFKDKGTTGTEHRDDRATLEALLEGAGRNEFDLVAAWSVNRLGRSLQDLCGTLGELHAKGVDLYLHEQGIDTTTPEGKVLFQMLDVFTKFERSIIQERVRVGLARARAQGKQLGRPAVSSAVEKAILAKRAEGMSMLKIARELGVGSSTVQRVVGTAEGAWVSS